VRGGRRLAGHPAVLGAIYIEDERGNRLLDAHAEPGHRVTVILPAGRTLYLRHRRGEAVLPASADELLDFEHLESRPPGARTRGALDQALHRGLFAAPFGPRYYRGYVDKDEEVIAVPLPDEEPAAEVRSAKPRPPAPATSRWRSAAWSLYGVSAALAVGAAVTGGLAADALAALDGTNLERQAAQAHDRAVPFEGAALGLVGAAAVAAGVGTWLLVRARRQDARPLPLPPTASAPTLRFGW
jgi:hypothetical protein